jgi:hypothetical protein
MAEQDFIGAQAYLYVIEKIKTNLLESKLPDNFKRINTVTTGDISEVDLSKQTIFPLSHIMVNNVQFNDHIQTFNVSVMLMDIMFEDNATEIPLIYNDDNELFMLNKMLWTGNKMVKDFNVGDLNNGDIYVDINTVSAEPFKDRFENLLVGWVFTFNVQVRNNVDICLN